MNKIRNAIIIAAGMGTRLRPLTLHTPKPLINVNGSRIIDTIISGLKQNGINNICIVVGYLKEKFDVLRNYHPEITIIENPFYKTCNNISSLYSAREFLGDTMIIDGDQIIYDPTILSAEFERSGYNAVWTDNETIEWLMTAENGRVTGCSRNGGKNGWQLYGISRWTRNDSERLRYHLEYEFETAQNRQIYWDDIPMFLYFDEFELGIMPMKKNSVKEIDSLEELSKEDNHYLKKEDECHE